MAKKTQKKKVEKKEQHGGSSKSSSGGVEGKLLTWYSSRTYADSLAFYLVHKHVERHEVSGDIEVVKVEKKKKVIVREE